MTKLHNFLTGAVLAGMSTAMAQTADDSLSTLFAGDQVRQYALEFYVADWQTQMEANYAGDLGYLPAKFTDGTVTLDSVGVRYKGNSSYNAAGTSPKKPLKIKFNEYVKGQKYYGAKILNFSNAYGDPTFLREKLAYDIAARYLPSPRASFVTLKTGSIDIGLYTQVEQVDEEFVVRHFNGGTGNLFKAGDAGSGLVYAGTDAAAYSDILELKSNENVNDWSGITTYMSFLSEDSAYFATYWRHYVGANNTPALLAFNMVLSNFDSYTGSGRNFYLYQTEGAYMDLIPWDMNLAFGGYSNGWDVYNQSPTSTANLAERPLFAQVLRCDTLRKQYLGYIREMATTAAHADTLKKAIDTYAALIRPYVEADAYKFYSLANFDANLTSKLRTASGTIPGLTEFATTRNAYLLAQVDLELASDYVLPVHVDAPVADSWTLSRTAQGWSVLGLTNGNVYSLRIADVAGKVVSARRIVGSGLPVNLVIPSGLAAVRIEGNGVSRTVLIHND